MKLIVVNDEFILKEHLHQTERYTNISNHEFKLYIKYGLEVTPERTEMVINFHINVQIQKQLDGILWDAWKDINQPDLLDLMFHSIDEYYVPYIEQKVYWETHPEGEYEYITVTDKEGLKTQEKRRIVNEFDTKLETFYSKQAPQLIEEKLLPAYHTHPMFEALYSRGFTREKIEYKEV